MEGGVARRGEQAVGEGLLFGEIQAGLLRPQQQIDLPLLLAAERRQVEGPVGPRRGCGEVGRLDLRIKRGVRRLQTALQARVQQVGTRVIRPTRHSTFNAVFTSK